jgi:predicted membrane-bound mannosyltransferase
MRTGAAPPATRRDAAWLAVVLVVALALRVGDMFVHPFGPDEGWTMELATGGWRELVTKTAGDVHPPLYYAMVKAWFALVGEGLMRAKLLSVLFDMAGLWLTWLLAREWFGARAGWFAVLAMALSPYMIYWSHVARSHILLPPLVAGLLLLSGRYLAAGGRWRWTALAVLWAVVIQLNYMAFPIGLVWGVVYILGATGVGWRRRAALGATALPGLAAFAPWMAVMYEQANGPVMAITFLQDFMTPLSLYHRALFGGMTHLQQGIAPLPLLVSMLAFVAFGAAGARRVGGWWQMWVLLLALPGVPLLVALVADYTLAERHLRFSLPVFFAFWGCCLACGAAWLEERLASISHDVAGEVKERVQNREYR